MFMQLQYHYVHVGNAYPVHVPCVQQHQSMHVVNHVAPLDNITGKHFMRLGDRLIVVNTIKSTLPLQ